MKLNEITATPQSKFITNRLEIKEWLEKNLMTEKYSIRPDGTVDVDGDAYLADLGLQKHLPIKFGTVNGFFSVRNNKLTSLDGFPTIIKDSLFLTRNKITSLAGISKHFEEIGGFINCDVNPIVEGGLGLILIKNLMEVTEFGTPRKAVDGTVIHPSDIIKKYLGHPNDLYECQAELIEHGFEEYAKI